MVSLTIKKRESHFLFCTPHLSGAFPENHRKSHLKARGYRHAHKMDERHPFVHSIYNYYNNVNLYCDQHTKRDDLI